ncbi:MAG: hypothetical protein NMNS01_12380 [Nitrosomonas sp.]|nr:MAG: hypothetical protein NMNS01_12380 [Nitrosomonas sp.]
MNRVSPEANSRDCIYIRCKETPINMKQLPVERWYPWCNATKLDTSIKLGNYSLNTRRGELKFNAVSQHFANRPMQYWIVL